METQLKCMPSSWQRVKHTFFLRSMYYRWKHNEVPHPQGLTPEVWMQVEAKIFIYVLSLFLQLLCYQQFPLPLTHHLKEIKKF